MRSRKILQMLFFSLFSFGSSFVYFAFFSALLVSLFLVLLWSFWSIVSFGNYECEFEVKLQAQQNAYNLLRFKRGIFKPFLCMENMVAISTQQLRALLFSFPIFTILQLQSKFGMELGVLSQIKILYIFFLDHFKYIRDQLMYNSAKCSCINKSSFDFQQKETKKNQ